MYIIPLSAPTKAAIGDCRITKQDDSRRFPRKTEQNKTGD